MKVSKLIMALAALCVALCAPVTGAEGVDNTRTRLLRQESAAFANKPAETGGTRKDSTNPLRRRDQALVSAHRVYDPVSGLACSLVGECVACPDSESDESCRETGFRQELDCPRAKDPTAENLLTKPEDERETRFKACSPADTARPGVAVVKFEAVMTVLLAVSVLLLRRERGKHMSSFDLRKDPRQRTGLLGGAASSDKSSD
uniref:PSI domain-containing protein n=1 Tax=Phytophthora ramorum TaxID=164328 RepID=H3H0E3_PHYRM